MILCLPCSVFMSQTALNVGSVFIQRPFSTGTLHIIFLFISIPISSIYTSTLFAVFASFSYSGLHFLFCLSQSPLFTLTKQPPEPFFKILV